MRSRDRLNRVLDETHGLVVLGQARDNRLRVA
jgi:hypothetical protein